MQAASDSFAEVIFDGSQLKMTAALNFYLLYQKFSKVYKMGKSNTHRMNSPVPFKSMTNRKQETKTSKYSETYIFNMLNIR